MAGTARPLPGAQDRRRVSRLAFGAMATQLIGTAVRMAVFDRIGDQAWHAEELAARCATDPGATARLLRALAGLGLLSETAPDTFATTTTGVLLRRDHPESMAALVTMFAEPTMLRAWEHLEDSVRTGERAFDTVFGRDFFGHLKRHPLLSEQFNTAMSQATRDLAELLPYAYDFGRFTAVADVGGGDGTLISVLLSAHPELRGIVYDTAEGLAQAPSVLERKGLAGRCDLVTGDFLVAAPRGADAHVLKSVLHDWTDEQCAIILGHCRGALPGNGRVLIVEPVLPECADGRQEGLAYLSDLNMLVNFGGRERSRAEFEKLCGRSGLAVVSVTPLAEGSHICLIEAQPD
ncbi:methyltransferase [Streptomyces chattanoogensis]|uniref:Methyltransferase n=1 Tax=Streptomyces chattanoogensis TaxID=66876 RepID=A0A0N0XQ66_9ACTN|nr:methyltransferase [Streptomyces chattanoogensis]KPC58563.1 methyltransferase [Streptomyces chattanoogensis]